MSDLRTVWKYRLARPGDSFYIEVPAHHRFVHAGLDGGNFSMGVTDGHPMPAVWAEVNPATEKVKVLLMLVATGQEYDNTKWEFLFTLGIAGYFFHLLRERS